MIYHTLSALTLFALSSSSLAVSLVSPNSRHSRASLDVVGPVTDLDVANKFMAPDGFNRSTVLADGGFPGPLIKAQKGDYFSINVINNLVNDTMDTVTSIHWHGILQHRTNYADGVSFVTQCPITPEHSFQYNFYVPDQSGTYWYHSHYSTQYCDGLRGPLVLYDPLDPLGYLYDIDDESTVITLADWYHEPSLVLNKIAARIVPNSTLINGLGRYSTGPSSPLAIVNVTHGKRYRFRIINIACAPYYIFSIDGHNMTVIEADGTETEPVVVDRLQIFAAQRYSVVVTADQPVGNYWIRALPNLGNTTFDGGLNSAIFRYTGASSEDPQTSQTTGSLLSESDLHPLINPGAPGTAEIGKADININFDLSFGSGRFTMNNVSFASNYTPILLQMINGVNPADLLPAGSVYPLKRNQIVEITIPATTAAVGGPHPFHLHGHSFDVIRVAGNSTANFVNPVRRDVVSNGLATNNDNVTIRFVTDNFGPWFFHCHIDWHLNRGLAVAMAEDPEDVTENAYNIPVSWYDLCPIYNSTVGF